jgi:hypothetical protein
MLSILTQFNNIHNITILDIINYNACMGKNVYVIDVYRMPIERKLSEFFENISYYHFNNSDENLNTYDINKIINRFNGLFPHIANSEYFNEKFNITVPNNFDYTKKYIIVTNEGNVKFIKLRLHDSSKWDKILTEILGTEITIITDYKTENKTIGDLYKKIKMNYKIPSNFFEFLLKDKYFLYYNSETERNKYFQFWNIKQTIPFTPYTTEEYNFYLKITGENQINNIVQREHYLDLGCVCNICMKKRYDILNKIKNGEKINPRIIHEEAVYEKNMNKQQQVIRKLRHTISVNRKIETNDNSINGFLMSKIITKKR